MESVRNRIDQFCKERETYCDGYGSGDSYSDGYSDGYGCGESYGYSDGYGYGCGEGEGYGCSDGYGDGAGYSFDYTFKISQINNILTKNIDDVLTAITAVQGNIAKGFIVGIDLSFQPCFIVKQDRYFAHGKTLKKALEALKDKIFESMPEEDRIRSFVESHELDQEYANRDFFEWHKKLTGSCEAGRMAFVRDHQIDLDGKMTTREFLELTKDSFGSNIIKKVEINYK